MALNADEAAIDPRLVTTQAAKDLLARPVFPAIGEGRGSRRLRGYVAVNGHDLARVEAEAYAARKLSDQEAHAIQAILDRPAADPDNDAAVAARAALRMRGGAR